MPKYEPPREDGLKGYVVTVSNWGKVVAHVTYAKTALSARHAILGRPRPGVYITNVRRKLEDESD